MLTEVLDVLGERQVEERLTIMNEVRCGGRRFKLHELDRDDLMPQAIGGNLHMSK